MASQTSGPGRYPKGKAVADIFPCDPRALNLIHYTTDRPESSLFSQLTGVTETGGPNFDGIQLNIAWPPVEEINKYWESQRRSFLVLQVGSKAMAQMQSIEDFVERVGAYLPMVKAVLINPGSEKRKPLDAAEVEGILLGPPERISRSRSRCRRKPRSRDAPSRPPAHP